MHDYGLWGTVPARPSPYPRALPDSVGVPQRSRRHGARHAVQRDGGRRRDDRAPRRASSRRSSSSRCSACCVPEPGFLEAIREVTKRLGIVLIFDEIVTGFRIAWGGAQERYGVVPDLACYGKAISGGFPMAAIAGRGDVMAVLDARSRPARAGRVGDEHAERQPGVRGRRAAPRSMCCRVRASTRTWRASARGCAQASSKPARATASPCRRPGEDAVFGVRFTEPASAAHLDGPDHRRQGPRLALGDGAHQARAAGQPEREVLPVDPHTDADIEHTLGVVDEAFAALRR